MYRKRKQEKEAEDRAKEEQVNRERLAAVERREYYLEVQAATKDLGFGKQIYDEVFRCFQKKLKCLFPQWSFSAPQDLQHLEAVSQVDGNYHFAVHHTNTPQHYLLTVYKDGEVEIYDSALPSGGIKGTTKEEMKALYGEEAAERAKNVKVQQQAGDWECGYLVMVYMVGIVGNTPRSTIGESNIAPNRLTEWVKLQLSATQVTHPYFTWTGVPIAQPGRRGTRSGGGTTKRPGRRGARSGGGTKKRKI